MKVGKEGDGRLKTALTLTVNEDHPLCLSSTGSSKKVWTNLCTWEWGSDRHALTWKWL
jgi:hypothetical protein